jgi:hypothetical protein
MPWDLSKTWNTNYAPAYLRSTNPEMLRGALNALMYGQPLTGKNKDPYQARVEALALNLRKDVINPWYKTTKMSPDISTWARDYWNWLAGGAKTTDLVPGNQVTTTTEMGDYGKNALHYVTGVGYVAEKDLESYAPEEYQALQAQRAKEVADTATVNPYYETNPVTTTTGSAAHNVTHTNLGLARPMFGQAAWPGSVLNPNVPHPAGMTRPETVAYLAARPHPYNTDPSLGPVYRGGANRNGNYAAPSVPGQTAKTPANAMAGGGTSQARQRVAKSVGRSISQAGVTRVPNMSEEYSRRVRQNMRKY